MMKTATVTNLPVKIQKKRRNYGRDSSSFIDISKPLKSLIREKGWTNARAAKELGRSPASITSYLGGTPAHKAFLDRIESLGGAKYKPTTKVFIIEATPVKIRLIESLLNEMDVSFKQV